MGFTFPVSTPSWSFAYIPAATVLINNAAEKSNATDAWAQMKTITLNETIYDASLFRFIFDLKSGGATDAKGRIKRNGAWIGTEQTVNGTTYGTKTEDIVATTWVKGDVIELWTLNTGGQLAYCRNFQLCGLWISNPFVNTLV